MRKFVRYPALALLLGTLTASLRMWQRAGYDESGLPVPFAIPSLVLSAFLGVCVGAFLYLALRQPETLEEQKLALPRGGVASGLLTAAGVLILVGGALNLLTFFRGYLGYAQTLFSSEHEQQKAFLAFLTADLMTGVLALAAVPTAVALLSRAKAAKDDKVPGPFAVLMTPVFCWLWLIRDFRQHTSNPILWDYVLLLMAIVVVLVSTYERAGFAFGVGKPRRTVFTSMVCLLLCIAALPDSGDMANGLTLLGLAVLAVAELLALMSALAGEQKTDVKEDVFHEQ